MTSNLAARRRERIARLIHGVPDFPTPGVTFKDITPVLADADGLRDCVSELVNTAPSDIDVVIGMEARGFILAAPVAVALGAGFVPVRKPGKLPRATYDESFALEYGHETLTVHTDAVEPGSRVLVIDDVLATGGTVGATAALIKRLGAELVHVSVLLELAFLNPREKLRQHGVDPEHVSAILRDE